MTTLQTLSDALNTAEAKLSVATKAAESARKNLASLRSSFGSQPHTLNSARDALSRCELSLRRAAEARDEAKAALDVATPEKARLNKAATSEASAAAAWQKFLVDVERAAEGFLPQLRAAKAASMQAHLDFVDVPLDVRRLAQLLPPQLGQDGLPVDVTPAALLRMVGSILEHRTLVQALAAPSEVTTSTKKLPKDFRESAVDLDATKWAQAVGNI
jgi:hypothetical protein